MSLDKLLENANPAILSDSTIRRLMMEGHLIKGELSPYQVQPNSVDLTLGSSYKKLVPNSQMPVAHVGRDGEILTDTLCRPAIDPAKEMEYQMFSFKPDPNNPDKKYTWLMPGEFYIMVTREIVSVPNGIVGIVCGRSSIARLGIQIEQAGFIDSGFSGTITLEVQNQTDVPIKVYEGMRVAQVYFLWGELSTSPYGSTQFSKYNGQMDPTVSLIHRDPELSEVTN
jgi:dCTP deaminase